MKMRILLWGSLVVSIICVASILSFRATHREEVHASPEAELFQDFLRDVKGALEEEGTAEQVEALLRSMESLQAHMDAEGVVPTGTAPHVENE